MPIPSRALQRLALAWLTLAAGAVVWTALVPIWATAGLLLAIGGMIDLWLGYRETCPIEAHREMPKTWPVGVARDICLVLVGVGARTPLTGELFDHAPDSFIVEGMPRVFVLHGARTLRLAYRATAQARGAHRFGDLEIRLNAPWSLWQWRYRLLGSTLGQGSVRVYPDFARIAHYTLLMLDRRLEQIGLLQRPRRGEGMEFQQLREYREGDTPRQIDWKASARHGKLVSREYQDERNQQIVFLLDCGSRMQGREVVQGENAVTVKRTKASHFDEALAALLLLSYVALRQGDGVGLSTFAHPKPRHLAPRRSLATLKLLMNAVYDLEATPTTPDFLEASQALTRQVRKRSLIIILTNLRDEDDDTLAPALALLTRAHLVLVASLREPGLAMLRQRPVEDFEHALAYAAATEYQERRLHALARYRKLGAHCLDVAPAELGVALVNQYWRMKRAGLL